MQVQPYLFFDGRCEEAVEFYRRALGAEVTMLMRFKESPDPASVPAGGEDKVMHMSFRIGESTVLASDGQCLGGPTFQGFSLSLTVSNDAEAERIYAALADAGCDLSGCRRRSAYIERVDDIKVDLVPVTRSSGDVEAGPQGAT